MSKGSMLMGTARGKLGEFVYARVNGQQVQRAYNSEPRNPQTTSQMYQRALFTDAVKFYTRGRRELFPFAFEDKKRTESNYNAFMRVNAKRGVVISKPAFENYNYPAVGNFVMSKGTLPPIKQSLSYAGADNVAIAMTKQVVTEATTITTVGDLSSILVDGVDFLAGDIITFVSITSGNPSEDNLPNVAGEFSGITDWDIVQIQLTPGSAQPISDFNIAATLATTQERTILTIRPTATGLNNEIYAGCIIHSRNTSTGVRVSTQELTLNSAAENMIADARERGYVDGVIESWRTTQKAPVISETIMQGNIAQSIAADFEPAGE